MDLLDSNLTDAKAAALFFNKDRDFPSSPVGKKPPCHAGISHAMEQLSQSIATTEPEHHN